MTLEITTGRLELDEEPGAEVAAAIEAAESVLTRRFGATVRLAQPENLGGSRRSVVLRLRVVETPFSIPSILVVKRYGPPPEPSQPDPFSREAVSYQLFNALPASERLSAELIAFDAAERVLVLEDLGRSPTLADKLLGDDARSAETALLGWARAMGRLHASTAGHEEDFDALLRRLGADDNVDQFTADLAAALAETPALLVDALGVATPAAVQDEAGRAAAASETSRFRAYSLADACPDNSILASRGLRFTDFEDGCVRDVVLDAAVMRVPFPSCWCALGLPTGMAEAMLAAWRAEIDTSWPELDSDAVLLPRVVRAQLLWVWLSTWRFLPRAGEPDRRMDDHLYSPRRSAVLSDRWHRLELDAEAADLPVVAAHAADVVAALRSRFGADAVRLPLYPAFR